MRLRRPPIILAAFGLPLAALSAETNPRFGADAAVSDILTPQDNKLDYGRAKIALDRIVDPTIDAAAIEKQIIRLVDAAQRIAGERASEGAKIDAVRKVLYEAGPWNDGRPFTYDHADPFGQNLSNKLLSTYLTSRRGNCVTMLALFMIVGRRIGLNLTLTTAPLHVLVRYTRPGIHPFNIEATSGGSFARDEWYRQQFPMSDRAIQSGLYLRTHTDNETVAVMATTVLEHLIEVGRNDEAVTVADAILAVNPKDGFVMVKKGTAIAGMMKSEFYDRFPNPNLIPASLKPRYAQLAAANEKAFAEAEVLGWQASFAN